MFFKQRKNIISESIREMSKQKTSVITDERSKLITAKHCTKEPAKGAKREGILQSSVISCR